MSEFDKYINYLPLILAGFSLTAILTPIVIKLALKYGVYDKPKSQVDLKVRGADTNIHDKIMPRMGFVAVILPIFFITPFFLTIDIKLIIVGITVLVLGILGIFDDKFRLSAKPQLIIQIICIAVIILMGVNIQEANNPFTGSFINFERGNFLFNLFGQSISISLLSAIITFIWIFFITNTIAWVDGVDGVLNGTVAIALLIILLVSIRVNSLASAVIAAIFLGANLGFLPYNFAPAKIINGYGGTIYGYIIAILSILGQVKLSVAIIAVIFPIMDVVWVIIYRVKKYKPRGIKSFGKAISTPGKVHLHHRLLDTGMSTNKVALTEYLLTACAGLIAILLSGLELTFVILSSVFVILLIFIILDKIRKNKSHQKNV